LANVLLIFNFIFSVIFTESTDNNTS